MKEIIILLAILVPASIRAQSRAWPDSSGPTSAGCYRIAVHPLTEVPPNKPDMSQITRLGYIYLDSIMRMPRSSAPWAAFDSINSFDSLKRMMKYLYAVSEYDPVLLEEYERDAPYIDTSYWGKPGSLIGRMGNRIGKTLQALGEAPIAAYVRWTSYILHIKVLKVSRDWDTMGSLEPPNGTPLCCIEARIIDTIKGKHILTGSCNSIYQTNSLQHGTTLTDRLSSDGCFHFDYCPMWSKTGSDLMQGFTLNNDSFVFTKDAMGWNALVPGNEYMVFLDAIYEDYDGTNSYFGIRPIMDGVGGIYPVVSGQVSDTRNYFGMGRSVDLKVFESGLKQIIYRIENP